MIPSKPNALHEKIDIIFCAQKMLRNKEFLDKPRKGQILPESKIIVTGYACGDNLKSLPRGDDATDLGKNCVCIDLGNEQVQTMLKNLHQLNDARRSQLPVLSIYVSSAKRKCMSKTAVIFSLCGFW